MAGGLSSAGGDASLTVTGQVISILTILALIFLDFAMERLEDAAAGHKHGQALLRAAYKELTVLGMVSFLMLVFARCAAPRGARTWRSAVGRARSRQRRTGREPFTETVTCPSFRHVSLSRAAPTTLRTTRRSPTRSRRRT